MKLLSLVVRNHRSFRDEFFLDLTLPGFKSSRPTEDASWEDVSYPVALIYGANASGKTAVVRADVHLECSSELIRCMAESRLRDA